MIWVLLIVFGMVFMVRLLPPKVTIPLITLALLVVIGISFFASNNIQIIVSPK